MSEVRIPYALNIGFASSFVPSIREVLDVQVALLWLSSLGLGDELLGFNYFLSDIHGVHVVDAVASLSFVGELDVTNNL